ncbi:MAG: DUF4421 family protein [Flavobacteriaceae bacterium]
MTNKNLLLLLFLFTSLVVQSQTKDASEGSKFFKKLDSLFIDHDLKNYSARVFFNYKEKRFKLINGDFKSRYVPNNKFGMGFGFASSKVLIDLAFNIKSGKKDVTNRFDAQGSLILMNHHYIDGYIQVYKGFNVRNNFNEPNEFRSDIKSNTVGVNYLYTFSEVEFSYSLLKAGLIKPDKNVYINGGIGGFLMYDYLTSNGSILPENGLLYFNEQADIKSYNQRAIGVMGGFLSAFVLPNNFIATFNLMPGIALANKTVTYQDGGYNRPSNPFLYKCDVLLALCYNVERYYINLTYDTGIYATDLDFNKYRFNLSMAKLAFGYKLKI